MKKIAFTLLLFLVTLVNVVSFAQSTERTSKDINKRANEIHLANSIYVMSVQSVMNSDMERGYKIKIHNGSSKQVVALNLSLNFNVKSNNPYDSGNLNCCLSKKIKVKINSKADRTYVLNDINHKLECDNIPSIEITTIVYSDGSFDEFKTGFKPLLK